MSYKNLEVLFDNSRSLYCFIDTDTHNIVYVNTSFSNFFSKLNENLIGEKYYKVLFNTNDCNTNSISFNSETIIKECNIQGANFDLIFSNLSLDGSNICIGKLTKVSSTQNHDYSETMLDCIEILKSETPFDETIDNLLELIVKYYDADGCYISSIDIQNLTFNYAYSYVVANDMRPASNVKLKLSLDDVKRWDRLTNAEPYLIIEDIEKDLEVGSIEYLHMKKCNIKNLYSTPIKNGDILLGFILIANPRQVGLEKFLFYSSTVYIKENLCRISMLKQLENKKNLDELTGLLNRAEYNKKLNYYVGEPPEQLGIIFCDINGLRKTNTDLGYEKGDKKIVECTQIMQDQFDEKFYRIGGDEFICFIEDLNEDEFYDQVSKLRQITQTNPKACFSVGCTWRSGDKISVKQVADADNMMYLNKQKYYQNAAFLSDTTGIDMLQDLLVAIRNNEFQVYLQPKINLETNEIIGAEALVRRYDAEKGKLIFPDQFIPIYENEAIIRHVDLDVLKKVCNLQKDWLKCGKKLKISVNFSRVTLKEDDIVSEIVKICDESEIPHDLIMVEITERIGLLDDADVSEKLIRDLVLNGFTLSLDDFGCAYSNIVTLSKIDVNEVKIDKSLVDFIETNKKNQIIVRNIIDMCNEMDNTQTVSEGIETQEQADLLRKFRCTQGQGFFYSRPLPALDFYNKYIVN